MKIIAFNTPTQGHINPTLPVVQELVRRGTAVIYYLTPGYRERIEATGATFRPYATIQDDFFEARGLDGSNPPRSACTLIETSRDILPALIDVVQAERPDLIFHDAMCPWGWLVARYTHLPTVASMSTLLMTPQLVLQSGQLLNLISLILRNWRYLRQLKRIASSIERRYHLKAPGFADTMGGTGTITLNYTSALFQPGSAKLPSSIKFVGPSIETRPQSSGFPFDQLDSRPLIYISLGTVINANRDFYVQCLHAFASPDYQVVMSVGNKIAIDSLGDIPQNFIVRPFVPQLEVLQRAHLFITHGGLNSVHEGLYYDVPLLLVPQQDEQRLTASRVQQLGVGINLAGISITASTLRDAARRILQASSFKAQAQYIGESLRSAGGYRRAADEILNLKPDMLKPAKVVT